MWGTESTTAGSSNQKKKFHSDSELLQWARQIAADIGFDLVISSVKSPSKKLLKCSRGERYRSKDRQNGVRKNTTTKATGCKFQLHDKKIQGCDRWGVVVFPGDKGKHNHKLFKSHVKRTGISPEAKAIIREMTSAQAKPCSIAAALKDKLPRENIKKKQVYNEKDSLWKESFEGRDVPGQLFHLCQEYNYIVWKQTEPETNVLTHLFFAHPESVSLLRSYYWFIGIDSTYKTNRYKMPLVEIIGMNPCNQNFLVAYEIIKDETEESYAWLLEKLRHLLSPDINPSSLVTDREKSLMNAIGRIFPKTSHLLCTWHINKDVEDKVYHLSYKDREYAKFFKNNGFRKIAEAQSIDDYNKAVRFANDSTKFNPAVMKYIESTWLIYKERFVRAWTDKVLHFGNTTTCRVESVHASLKQWLNSSKGALDTVWIKANKQIEIQLIEIRSKLQHSLQRKCKEFCRFPFNLLTYRVSQHCISLLNTELSRMRVLSGEVFDRYHCVLINTHRIPCACELKRAMDSKSPVRIERVHPFWRKLQIEERVGSNVISGADQCSEEQRYLDRLVSEAKSRDPAVVASVALRIHDELYPDQSTNCEPEVKMDVRGRPKGSVSTKRNPSGWEYSRGRGRGRGSGRGRGPGRGRGLAECPTESTSLVQGQGSTSVQNTDAKGKGVILISNFSRAGLINSLILPFVESVFNPMADGNCGFRVVADEIFGDQKHWMLARQSVINELKARTDFYQIFYGHSVSQAIERIEWDGGICEENHWMKVVADLYPIATTYNAVVFCFMAEINTCLIVLPLQAASTSTRPEREIAICHLGLSYPHFIRLNLMKDSPVPPIITYWRKYHKPSVDGWDAYYFDRIAQWERLRKVMMLDQYNGAKDVIDID